MTDGAFKATFSDFKNVKTRKTLQLIFEVPAEAANAALDILGGVPRADQDVWVGIARIDPKAPSETHKAIEGPTDRQRQKWRELSPAKQAAIRCKEPAFQKFISERYDGLEGEASSVDAVREICGVKSRADILESTTAAWHWQNLDREFQAWLSV